ncbi:sodium-dependent glucose transporter 1B-like [Tetranychus urticae]|uniref:Major facilitator superfamily (MFS) profile domain-containing protein n=1 Tax=Tetranychus urticae TaxID=32264 RepID=T1KK71_TETUR|nr:sodium-dependent glucose transporter 1B-like [Tetranychus urticae]
MKLSNYVQTNEWKLIKTFFCCLTYFTSGGCGTLLGSSLLDLQIRLGVSFKQLSSLAPSRSIGFFIGGLISGFLNMCFGPDMVLFGTIFFAGVTTILAPWFKQFYGTYACLLLSGFAQGIFEIYTNICILSTWNQEVSVYVQILHGSFGLGSLLAPLLVKPFLLPLVQNETETQSDQVTFGDYNPDDVKVQYPYLILGSILVFGSFGFLFFHFKNKSIKNANESTDVEIVDDDHPVLKKMFAVFIVACIAHTTFAVDLITGSLAPAFVVKSDLRMTKQNGANLVSAFWFCLTCYRILFIVLIKFINERRVIIFNCTLSIIGLILMCIYPTHSQVITWISFMLLAIGISPTFSSSLGLLQKYITVSDRYASFLFVFGAAGEAAHPWVISKFMDSLPKLFAYYVAVLSIIQVVSVLSLPSICQKLFRCKTNTTLNRLASVRSSSK